MGYHWTNEAILLKCHLWLDYRELCAVLNSIKYKNFSVKANRDLARTALKNMRQIVPFDISRRFPENGVFIDMSHSVPSSYLTQILMALDLSDRQAEKLRNVPDSVDSRQYSNFEDAKTAYYKALYGLLDLGQGRAIEKMHCVGIYVLSSFEAVHIKWT